MPESDVESSNGLSEEAHATDMSRGGVKVVMRRGDRFRSGGNQSCPYELGRESRLIIW